MNFKNILQRFWLWRGRYPTLNFPAPCPLPYGGWFLAYGDMTGLKLLSYRLTGRRSYEEESWQFVVRFLKEDMVFFDIGANQGFYTILAARRVGSKGKVFAFEPAYTERRKLKRNLIINRLKNVVVSPEAVGGDIGSTEFYLCLDSGPLSSIRPQAEDVISRTKVVKVPLTTLDAQMDFLQLTSLDFIKVDAEGGELDVLKGGKRLLQTLRPLIMCEMADIRTRQWGYAASEIYDLLVGWDYHWFSLSDDGFLRKADAKEEYLDDYVNLIAIPVEKEDDIFHKFGQK